MGEKYIQLNKFIKYINHKLNVLNKRG